ncbi:MAG: Orotate phosphoribosyltransferase [Nitrosopumilales archaeon]|nr:MAG: Orotate phosphoribosyltransferase [Nitrosopumilales archaeon]
MEFVKDFATFLHEKGAIKFGDFTLSSGKKSPYYIDLRLTSSYPHIFRKMIKHLQQLISEKIGLDNFDTIATVPTGGLVVATALAFETVKPLIYVRSKQKEHGTSKSIEGITSKGMKVLMIDDVATTGESMSNGIKVLKDSGVVLNDAYVIVNRLEGADSELKSQGVNLHQITDVLEITKILHQSNLVDDKILEKVKNQIL